MESYFKEKCLLSMQQENDHHLRLPSVKRKLILHFDQHNTIQVACTLPGRCVTVEEGLNNFLTSAVWGKETQDGQWVWCCKEPQIAKPTDSDEVITYFKFLEKKIVKTPDDRAELKKRTCRFVYEEPGCMFRQFFDLYLQSLIYDSQWPPRYSTCSSRSSSTKDPTETPCNCSATPPAVVDNEQPSDHNQNGHHTFQEEQEQERATKDTPPPPSPPPPASTDTNPNEVVRLPSEQPSNTIKGGDPGDPKLYHLILPEFFDMIRRLQKEKRDFVIVLRTMGIDSHNFLETVTPVLSGQHPQFTDIEPMHINMSVGHLKRYSLDHIELEMDGEVYKDEKSIYAKLNSLTGICAIRDDFAYWQKHDYVCYSAKPLWVNLNDERHQHILFDDNIRLDSKDDCIVNLRFNNMMEDTDDKNEYHNVDFESYKIFERTSIIQPNLIELLNPLCKKDSRSNHYYDKIRQAENNYNIVLLNKTKIQVDTTIDEASDSDSDPSSSELDDSNGLNRSRKFSRIITPPNFPVNPLTTELKKLDKTSVLGEEADESSENKENIPPPSSDKPAASDTLSAAMISCDLVEKSNAYVEQEQPASLLKTTGVGNRHKKPKNFVRINTGFPMGSDDAEKAVVSTACLIQ